MKKEKRKLAAIMFTDIVGFADDGRDGICPSRDGDGADAQTLLKRITKW